MVENSAKVQDLELAVEELRAQLAELIQAKKDDEAEVLEKFRKLLNEKKVKIRQQQRLIVAAAAAGGKRDPVVKSEPEPSQPAAKGRRAAGPSRVTKRKAAVALKDDSSESDEGFERMDMDPEAAEEPADSDEQTTTEDEDEATASEADDEPEPPVKPPRAPARSRRPDKGETKPEAPPKIPPKRELPFVNKKAGKPPPAVASPVGSETESDDEL